MPKNKPVVVAPGSVPRVLVCSAADRTEQADLLASSLRRHDLQPLRGDFADTCARLDLVVQLAAANDMAAAIQQLSVLRTCEPDCPVIVASLALDALQLQALLDSGARDFVNVPADPGELAIRVRRLLGGPAMTRGAEAGHPSLRALVGDSPSFLRQVGRLPLFAKYDASVMILGDTGTGKELCAQAIHYLSDRAGGPWVAVNCAAIPTELMEDELFGHVKGAYTNAHAGRDGLVSEAEGGTLFLDEIDSLPFGAQGKLLRFLQEKEYRPVGSSTTRHADVRIIAASNRQLAQLRATKAFRQDLLYRLNVLTLHMPSLRERRADIPVLALHFVRAAAAQWGKRAPSLTPAAVEKLLAHDWPGNVRELKNVIERSVLMGATGALVAADIDLDGVPAPLVAAGGDESFRTAKARVVENFERAFIEQLLERNGGNVAQAARSAQKNRRAFFELMRKYCIDSSAFRAHE